MRRVVITGIGAVTPLGNNVETTWKNLLKGRSGIGCITRFDASGLSGRIAGELKDFCPEDYLPPKDILRLDPFIHYAAAAATMALEDARLISQQSNPPLPPFTKGGRGGINHFSLFTFHSALASAGVIIGSSRGGISTLEKSLVRFSPYLMPSTAISMASSYISMRFGIKGTAIGISTSCASGANAVGEALKMIQRGDIDLAISGGTEAPICRLTAGGYAAAGALSKRNSEPSKASRPFDKDRDGFVIAEGAGVLILEELNNALKRKAKIYAEIAGYGTSSDAFHLTKPDSRGEALAISRALSDAKVSTGDVGYINAHATSTILGDKAEIQAIKKVFGREAYNIPITACKSMLGHMLGGAGAVEAVISALSISRGVITPTINLVNPDIDRKINYIRDTEKRDINIAISNSFGFGGVNAVLVLKKF